MQNKLINPSIMSGKQNTLRNHEKNTQKTLLEKSNQHHTWNRRINAIPSTLLII